MKKKKLVLAALATVCFPTLVLGQVDQQYAQQMISHVQGLKQGLGESIKSIRNELMPAIKQRMARDFPEQYAKLTQSNADDDAFLIEYNNSFVNKEYNLFKEDCENKIKEKGKITGRKTLKTPYNDGYSFQLENSHENCFKDAKGAHCLTPTDFEPYRMYVEAKHSYNEITCEMADKTTNTRMLMRLHTYMRYNMQVLEEIIGRTTYDYWFADIQRRKRLDIPPEQWNKEWDEEFENGPGFEYIDYSYLGRSKKK